MPHCADLPGNEELNVSGDDALPPRRQLRKPCHSHLLSWRVWKLLSRLFPTQRLHRPENRLVQQDGDAHRASTNQAAEQDEDGDARANGDCVRSLFHEDAQHWNEAHKSHSALNKQPNQPEAAYTDYCHRWRLLISSWSWSKTSGHGWEQSDGEATKSPHRISVGAF